MSNVSQTEHQYLIGRRGVARVSDREERLVVNLVEGIVRATRLWADERNEVRVELLDHFDDGIEAGQSVEKLLRDFGSPQVAAALIRKAKRRNRSWKWHAWHYGWQASVVAVGVLILSVVFIVQRLHSARPGPLLDVLAKIDETVSKVPVADRAWPHYRAGMIALHGHRNENVNNNSITLKISLQGSKDSEWKKTTDFLDANVPGIKLLLEGTTKPHMGYVYRDPANNAWLFHSGYRSSSAMMYPANQTSEGVLLPQVQELSFVSQVFHAAAVRAMEAGDLATFRLFWQAQARLAGQLLDDPGFLVNQGAGKRFQANALLLLRRLVSEHPSLLSDADLVAWRGEIKPERWKSKLTLAASYRTHVQEFLQNGYTQGPDGDGRITFGGCQYLRRWLHADYSGDLNDWQELDVVRAAAGLTGTRGMGFPSRSGVDSTIEEMVALRWSTTLANRKAMQAEFDRLLKLLDEESSAPVMKQVTTSKSVYTRELVNIAHTPKLFRRYWPILVILPRYTGNAWRLAPPEELSSMHCEATLATIALEQFRRRTGSWPASLQQLVPQDLPREPIDIYKGRALVYRLVNGQPLLYSLGDDTDDDGGNPVPPSPKGKPPFDGDIRFLPVDY